MYAHCLIEIVQILGLDICADTIVGDQMRRGISGGQKKRVTTGSIYIGNKNVLYSMMKKPCMLMIDHMHEL
jgi:hypothetical protein